MSRPLRIEFPGALYHVTSRGDRREPIYRDDGDRRAHLAVIAQAMCRFDARLLAYCLMGNHYHLILETGQANLSRVMRHVNGIYTQRFNRRHGLVGHLFQGRFNAILVDRDAYLLTLCRYVECNPVAAGLVHAAVDWPWSSYRAHVGSSPAEDWLDTSSVHRMLLRRDARCPADRRLAASRYAALVADRADNSPWDGLRRQVFLGDDAFVERSLSSATPDTLKAREIPRLQRQGTGPSADRQGKHGARDRALHAAYKLGEMTMSELAVKSGLSVSRVSRIIASQEQATGVDAESSLVSEQSKL